MKHAVTRRHLCIVDREAVEWFRRQPAESFGDGIVKRNITMMTMPPPEDLISTKVIVPSHFAPDGSLVAVLELTTLEDSP